VLSIRPEIIQRQGLPTIPEFRSDWVRKNQGEYVLVGKFPGKNDGVGGTAAKSLVNLGAGESASVDVRAAHDQHTAIV